MNEMMDVIPSLCSRTRLSEAKNLACYSILIPDASPDFGGLSMTGHQNAYHKPVHSFDFMSLYNKRLKK